MKLEGCRTLLLGLALAAGLANAHGATLRWAARGDAGTLDPYAFNEIVTNNINELVYDYLVARDRNLAIVPSLALSWSAVNDTTWRFNLRHDVTFQDGSRFTAADAAFSIERAQKPTSQIAPYARALGRPVVIDDYTLELHQDKPDPLLLEHLNTVYMMSRAWCIANKVEAPLDYSQKEESYASRHAMGTGPYVLVSREPGVKTVFKRNPHFWHAYEGNVTDLVFTPIGSDPTRTAALLSGDVDLVTDPAPQDIERLSADPALRTTSTTENRVLFFGMDQGRDELLYSNVKGKNPLKDVRVREALFKAIDAEAIRSKIMHGQAVPTGCMTTGPQGCLDKSLEPHPPVDIDGARKLLAEAGYPDGFALTLDCPNDRYVNDRDICVALVGMLARVGIKLEVNAMPKALFFPKVEKLDTSFYMVGWGGSTLDAQIVLDPLVHTFDAQTQRGGQNFGRFSDAELDKLIDASATDMNTGRRAQEIIRALHMVRDKVYYLPLDRPALTWVSRANVKPVILSSALVRVDWIQIDEPKR